jgi:hypothetical protein
MLVTCYLRQDPGIPPGMDALENDSFPVLTICGKDITATRSDGVRSTALPSGSSHT